MILQNETQRADLIEAGKRLGNILRVLRGRVAPGMTSEQFEDIAEQMIREGGDEPSFLGYMPEGSNRPYPAALCVSINDEVVHGIPNEGEKVLKEGDIVTFDLGLTHNGIIVDAAITVPVGTIDTQTQKLLSATEKALAAGIAQAVPGNRVGAISHAIQKEIESGGFKVIKELGGHGVGERVHEEPFVPNFGRPTDGPLLKEGMVLALEPIATAGKATVTLAPDGYTYRTKDGSLSAHYEHTILIEKNGPLIVTK